MTAYPLSRSVTPVANGVEGRTAQPFAETSERSVAIRGDVKTMITALTAGEKLTDEKIDKRGPVPIAAAVSAASTPPAAGPSANPLDPEAPKPEARVAVIGDSDFAANAYLGIQGNRDMFMNTLGWLSQQENLIAIRPKEAGDRRITLTATATNADQMVLAVGRPRVYFRDRHHLVVAETTLKCAASDRRLRCWLCCSA